MKRLPVMLVALFALILVQGGSVAQSANERFTVTDTAQGAVRLDVNTGRSWLLVTGDGRPRWVEIAEPAAPAAESLLPVNRDELRLPDARYKVARDSEGRSYGIKLAEAGSGLAPLEAGDVITQIEHFHVQSILALRIMLRLLREAKLTEVPVKVLRAGEEKTLTVKLSVLPPSAHIVRDAEGNPIGSGRVRADACDRIPDYGYPDPPPRATELPPSAKVVKDAEGNPIGIEFIKAVGPFEIGDILTQVEGQAVRSMADLRRVVRAQYNDGKRTLRMTITRGDEEKILEWNLPDKADE